jgi:hypothetical protein
LNSETAFLVTLVFIFVVAGCVGFVAARSWLRFYFLVGAWVMVAVVVQLSLIWSAPKGEGWDNRVEIFGHWVEQWPAASLWWGIVPWLTALSIGAFGRFVSRPSA